MKHEIEIPDLPDGWEAVAYRKTNRDDEAIFWNRRLHQICDSLMDREFLIVRKKHPRRIVLEETGNIRQSCYSLKIDDGNLILPPGREYKIVEDNKCAE